MHQVKSLADPNLPVLASPVKDCPAPSFSPGGQGSSLPSSPGSRDDSEHSAHYNQSTKMQVGQSSAAMAVSTAASPTILAGVVNPTSSASPTQNAQLATAASNALVFSLQCPRPPLSLSTTPTILTPQMPAALPPPGALHSISHPPPLSSQPSKDPRKSIRVLSLVELIA